MANIHVVFELTMPNCNSWNGKWSGEHCGHYIFKDFPPVTFKKQLESKVIGSWYYDFKDGWGACVSSRVVDGTELRKLKKANCGFSGYNWMVDSILYIGEIKYDWAN